MAKYLDENGLLYLWTKLKALLAGKVDAAEGMGLSANDFTDAEKAKLAGIAAGANNYTHPTYSTRAAGLYMIAVDDTGHVELAVPVTKATITSLGIPAQDTTYSDMGAATASAAGTHGLVPAPAAGAQAKFLRGDGTWQTPANTTYAAMTGATSTAAGTAGLVPAPAAGKQASFLRGDGTWVVPTNTTYAAATASANGLMSAADKVKLDGFGAASTYALKTDVTGVYKYKGSVAAVSNLPSTGNTTGDVYNVEATGMNYAWDGTAWDALGQAFTIDAVTNAEIDAVLAS